MLITRKSPDLLQKIEAALRGGIDAVQLRDKESEGRGLFHLALEVRKITRRYNAELFINSRADIALAVHADGVHFPENSQLQKWPNLKIGASVHSFEAAEKAEREGADFLLLSPIFASFGKGIPLGLDFLKTCARKTSLPIYALGGVTAEKIPAILKAGAYGAAAISAILDAPDPFDAAESFSSLFKTLSLRFDPPQNRGSFRDSEGTESKTLGIQHTFQFRGIYGIVSTFDAGVRAIQGGVKAIQFRWKEAFTREAFHAASQLSSLCLEAQIPFFINDRADIAKAVNASGVHLGQTDIPIHEARNILGAGKLIGATVSNSQEAEAAEKQGADYIGLGHVFPTQSKQKSFPPIGLEMVRQVKERISIPLIAIGGIDGTNAASVFAAGADGIAILSALHKVSDVLV